ncbi:RDD family protein [Alteromonas ponticola]|uniref:RDD family protein n=1 Tax=Alteromonas aquimaris TaxID=2998417 RepID=A0ABT3P5U8_9ALTE|nr:RDD family protein [Alteromonas aquimaris]MCW8108143.1 RDD family protein [Alteromonas aquimaris]
MTELITDSIKGNDLPENPTSSETREIVTPFAFQVSVELLGKPLATPLKRCLAILVDLFLISVVSLASALVLAFFAAITFVRAGSHLADRPKRGVARKCLRLGAAFLLFVTIFGVVEAIDDDFSGSASSSSKEVSQQLATGIGLIALEQCGSDVVCHNELALELSPELASTGMTRTSAEQLIQNRLADKGLTALEKEEVITHYLKAYGSEKETKKVTMSVDFSPSEVTDEKATESENYSVIKWIKGIAADLGLGFGWAALYFSVFTAWWGGVTPGKKLCGLRVVKLDNSSLTLWESFGRYGGYGAGLATGLLGFLQIYWDPNRQAIQDKISETLVIDIRRQVRANASSQV